MPYIKQEQREEIASGERRAQTPGELNYIFSCLAGQYLADRGERYYVYNEIIAALECAKLELYRRMIAPYEDKSIKENGDVY